LRAIVADHPGSTYGNNLKTPAGEVVLLDFSAVFANGIFLQFSSVFPGRPPVTEIMTKIRHDEMALFKLLNIEERAPDA